MERRFSRFFFTFFLCLATPVIAVAQSSDASLEKKARGVLENNCFKCHSHKASKNKGGLILDSRAAMLKGGDTGPAVMPGQPDKSLLVKAVTYIDEDLQMPPSGKRLTADDIALLTAWVKAGAPWTDAPAKTGLRIPGRITDEDRAYWAFQPIRPIQTPALDEINPIDRFIRARLQKEGLPSSPAADPRALIRRAYFDVTGLPPTPEEMDEFVNAWHTANVKPQAVWEALVDRLLASPHYGERWGRHWLDVVRFAESDGYRLDSFRPQAWRYRDFVIKAFNDDKPYDRFVREQIAGDELYPDNPESLVGIGFLTHSIYEFNQRNVRGQWNEIMSDIVDVTGEVFMGLSVGCARCHDHKFDPILQKDYFALRAFFEGMMPSEELPDATMSQQQEFAKKRAVWLAKTEKIRAQISSIEDPVRQKNAVTMTSKFPKDLQGMMNKPASERTPLEQQLATLAHRQILYEYEKLDTQIKGAEKDRLLALRKDLAKFDADKPAALPMCQGFHEVGPQPPETTFGKKSEPTEPAFLTVLNESRPSIAAPKHQVSSGRRAALAQWLTRPDHPLTTRVLVNRIWQQHFGRGLVGTASDFGNLGEKPSHPELLEWLAQRFVADGWSIKKLHRQILTSKTYQQSSLTPPDALALQKDPDNRLLWGMPTRRLDAEQIRDAMLAVTGKLDRTVGGPSVELKEPRRSVYLKWLRNTKEPLLEVFDIPDGFTSAARRNVTTTSTQALYMLNSPLMVQQGGLFADRLHKDNATTDEQKIDRAFRLALGRSASSKEKLIARDFLAEQTRRVAPPKDKTPVYETAKIPFREGKAAIITPGSAQARFQLPKGIELPGEQFTLEAFVYLRSVFEDGTVRTIASHWNGDTKGTGWSFGVTGKKSAYKPQTLVLQMWGKDANDKSTAEAVFSGFPMQLNRPYYVGVAVNVNDAGDNGITFYLKDLANDEEPMLVYATTHKVVKLPAVSARVFTIGGTVGKQERSWDGMIDDVRLSDTMLAQKQLLVHADRMTKNTVAYWQFEQAPGMLHDSSPHRLTLERYGSAGAASRPATLDARRAAWIDFCQVLLNANEFLYVD